jgi:hypothetical protein
MDPTRRLLRHLGLGAALGLMAGACIASAAVHAPSAPGIAAAKGAAAPPMSDPDFAFRLYTALRRKHPAPTDFVEVTPQALGFDFAPFCLMPREEERRYLATEEARMTQAGVQQLTASFLRDCHVRVFAGQRGGRERYVVIYMTAAPVETRSLLFREATGDDVLIGAFSADAKATGYAHRIF